MCTFLRTACRFSVTTFHSTIVIRAASSSRNVNARLNSLLVDMPKLKNVQGASEVRAAVLKNKAKRTGYEPSEVTLNVLGPGSAGTCRALMLSSDSVAYLFNCGEGTQRLITEHKMKLVKLEQVFLTSSNWDNVGGLPGLAITAADMGIPSLSLHGPPDCERLVLESQGFVNIDEMTIFTKDCWSPVDFSDELITVKAVPLSGPKKSVEDVESPFSDSFYYDKRGNGAQPRGRIRVLSESENDHVQESGTKRPRVPEAPHEMTSREVALAFVVKTRAKLGTLLLDKCVDLGVPKGPLLGKLKNNIPVTLEDGRVIDPRDVRSPDDPGKSFIVVDCPSEDFLNSLCNDRAEDFRSFFSEGDVNGQPSVVVHFTPVSVMKDPRYQAWVQKFHPSTYHLVLNEEVPCSGSLDVHRMQTKLNLLDDVLFPKLKEKYPEGADGCGSGDDFYSWMRSKTCLPSHSNAWLGYPGVKFRLRAKRNEGSPGLDRQGYFHVKHQEYLNEVLVFPDAPKLIAETRELIAACRAKQGTNSLKFPQITFLGTGSAIPNKSRNTSGILVSLNETSRLVMDCGEGTLGQLVRFFGQDHHHPDSKTCSFWEVLRQIDAVYISHLHADHHIGLIGLLRARRRAFSDERVNPSRAPFKPACILAPPGLKKWLDWYSVVYEKIDDTFEFFDNKALFKNVEVSDEAGGEEKTAKQVAEKLNITGVETCFVQHCFHSFGVKFTVKTELGNDFTLVYSGDCRPSESLVQLGLGEDDAGCDLLVHEATVEDDLEEDAVMKRHCTASEALDVARKMKARRILFTHFSQRYKIPVLSDEVSSSVGIAFDNMQISPSDFEFLPALYRPLRAMFAEHVGSMELKTSKYLKRKEAAAVADAQ